MPSHRMNGHATLPFIADAMLMLLLPLILFILMLARFDAAMLMPCRPLLFAATDYAPLRLPPVSCWRADAPARYVAIIIAAAMFYTAAVTVATPCHIYFADAAMPLIGATKELTTRGAMLICCAVMPLRYHYADA